MSKKFNKSKLRQKFYNSKEWKKVRDQVLLPGTLCATCEKVLATAVHHIKSPFTENKVDEKLALGLDNLEPICRDCHGYKSIKFYRCRVCGEKLKSKTEECNWCQNQSPSFKKLLGMQNIG